MRQTSWYYHKDDARTGRKHTYGARLVWRVDDLNHDHISGGQHDILNSWSGFESKQELLDDLKEVQIYFEKKQSDFYVLGTGDFTKQIVHGVRYHTVEDANKAAERAKAELKKLVARIDKELG